MSNPFRMHPDQDHLLVHRNGMLVSFRPHPIRKQSRILRLTICNGYARVPYWRAGRWISREVHGIVLEAFVGPCPSGMECRHLDGDGTNNHISNLRWGTRKENAQDRRMHGTLSAGVRHVQTRLSPEQVVEIRRRRLSGEIARTIAGDHGISLNYVYGIAHRHSWKSLP